MLWKREFGRRSHTLREILAVRSRERSWHETARALAPVLTELGDLWASSDITILEEHRASERFARALSATAETIVIGRDSPIALLAAAGR